MKKGLTELVFILRANIDAFAAAERFEISKYRAANYNADSEGALLNYEVIGEEVSCMSDSHCISENRKDRIKEDFKKRGGRR